MQTKKTFDFEKMARHLASMHFYVYRDHSGCIFTNLFSMYAIESSDERHPALLPFIPTQPGNYYCWPLESPLLRPINQDVQSYWRTCLGDERQTLLSPETERGGWYHFRGERGEEVLLLKDLVDTISRSISLLRHCYLFELTRRQQVVRVLIRLQGLDSWLPIAVLQPKKLTTTSQAKSFDELFATF